MTDDSNRTLRFNVPSLFVPSVVRSIVDGGATTGILNAKSVSERNIGTTSSFRYDPPGAGIRSVQQIGIDYSKFENFIFFQSARVAVNLAMEKMINNYPFDGTQKEVEEFIDGLTGFEKYIFDIFPRSVGYLNFSGSSAPGGGSYILVEDFAGSVFPSISTLQTGESKIDPGLKSLSLEMHTLFHTGSDTFESAICQKISGSSQGFTLFVEENGTDSTKADLTFEVVSGSSILTAQKQSIDRGAFHHVVATFNRRPGNNKLELYLNQELVATSSNAIEFGAMDFAVSPLLIGSGSSIGSFTPTSTFSGSMDEFRLFHDIRTIEQQKAYGKKGIFKTPELVLYFKFNEPSGTLGDANTNKVALDYSGNSLHSLITNFSFDLRNTGSMSPISYEKSVYNPVLFPGYQSLITLNANLLTSASNYDASNPNIITRLVPPHYFLEGQFEESFASEDGTIVDAVSGSSIPGSADPGQAQIMQTILFMWAKFFDELKIVLDNFGKILNVTYDGYNSAPDQLLPKIAEYYGFSLPNLFDGSSIEQFVDAENLVYEISTSEQSLKHIQNQIWRRILVNIRDIIESKGTLHSVKAFIRALGIDPDSNFRIREYGGPTKRNLSEQRELRTEVSTMIDMSGSSAFIQSKPLLAFKNEPGFPE